MQKNSGKNHMPRNDTSTKKRRRVHAIKEPRRRNAKFEQRVAYKKESEEKGTLELGFGL